MTRRRLVGLTVLILLLAGCASTLITTGETLSALEKQFLETANRYEQLHAAGRVSDATYQKWRKFTVKFVADWNRASDFWDASVTRGDPQSAQAARTIVDALRSELTTLGLDLTPAPR